MIVKYRHWIALGVLTLFGAWMLAPVGSTAGGYVLDSYKEVQVYLEEHIEVQRVMGGSTIPDPRFMRKGGEIR